jgi:large subunit ribosomal protein L24
MSRPHFRIKKNEEVEVIAGREKGKRGKVLKVIPKKERVVVEKVNFIKRHTRPGARSRQGGIVEKEGPLHISNVMLVCSKCERAVRVGYKILDDQRKVRHCRRCGEILDK